MPTPSLDHRRQKTLSALGKAIIRLRRMRGLSQEQLALVADIDRSHIGRIERGENNLTIMNIVRISTALKISVAELMREAKL